MGFCRLLFLANAIPTSWFSSAKGERNKCRPPDILNGISSPHRVNHTTEDEIRYECKGGFSPSILGTVVKCRSTGWFPAPRCSLTPCDFSQSKNGNLYYDKRQPRPYFPVPIRKKYRYYCNRGFLIPSGSYWNYLQCTVQWKGPAVPRLNVEYWLYF
ncbi:complement factor H-like [Rattus norvegicus]|uniref:complement factor H-like n=1 Tax=Rattus norvegicus TaxID=10116 RepID=UPI0003D0B37D|nr:complement factor H-like [Rattus norvegicus]|eukprot:XP_006250016.1 PREDICTED: complement factor H-like [Rattus norvegicus]